MLITEALQGLRILFDIAIAEVTRHEVRDAKPLRPSFCEMSSKDFKSPAMATHTVSSTHEQYQPIIHSHSLMSLVSTYEIIEKCHNIQMIQPQVFNRFFGI